jgi:hypothetical protein
MFGPPLSNTGLVRLEPIVQQCLGRIVERVRANALKGSVDLSLYCKYFALDVSPDLVIVLKEEVSGELTFGIDFNTVETEEHRELIYLMELSMNMATYVS